MFLPPPLPRTLFQEIGKIVVVWTTIEQSMILHTSAMAAMRTDGKPVDYLRMDFTRLRKKWFALCRENFDAKTFNKIINPLNSALATASETRGLIVHGMWEHVSRGKYRLICYEQKDALISYENNVTLGYLQGFTQESFLLSVRLKRFVRGEDGFGEQTRSFLKIVSPVEPRN